MYTYQRRSDNRQTLRLNQSRSNISHSQCSREGSSKKKFIQVYSKKVDQTQTQKKANLRSSTVSLPVQFDQRMERNSSTHHLARSQFIVHPNQFCNQRPGIINNYNDHLARSQSVQPPKTIIIKQTILRPAIVSFSQLPGNTGPQKSYYRQSFPVNNILQNKSEILQAERFRQAAAPIKMLSNNMNQIHDFSDIQKIIVQPVHHFQPAQSTHNGRQTPFFVQHFDPTVKFPSSNPILNVVSNGFANQKFLVQRNQILQKSSKKDNQPLSNKHYIECEVKLQKSWKPSLMTGVQKRKEENDAKDTADEENYNSLKIMKQNKEQAMKQNLELGKAQCKCEKQLKMKENEVKVNRRQTLQPKKNFIFV